VFYGWWIVAAGCAVQWYISAVFWRGFTAFFDPIVQTFGWSRGATAGALSLQRSESGLISPFVGTILDKFGPRNAMIFGVVVTGAGFILMSRVQTLWQFYLSMALLTVGMSFGTFIVLVTTVSNWFIRRRSIALSVLMAAAAVGGMSLPVLVNAIDHFGWRDVLMSVGIGFWIVGLPASFVMRRRPEDHGLTADGPLKPPATRDGSSARPVRETNVKAGQALKLRFFWQLALATSLGQLVSASNLLFLPALTQFEVNAGAAALAVGSIAFGDLAGRLGVGFLGDRVDKRLLLTAAFTVQTLGIVGFALVNLDAGPFTLSPAVTLPVFVVGFGLGFGASIPLRLAILADYFGRKSYGSILGITSSVSAVFGAIGPVFAGAVFDVTGSYRPAFVILACLLSLSIPLTLTLQSQPRVAAMVRLRQLSGRTRTR
jgi:sugar phosphate permease